MLEVAVGEYERDLNKLINAANKKYHEDSDLYHLENFRNGIENVNGELAFSGTLEVVDKCFCEVIFRNF